MKERLWSVGIAVALGFLLATPAIAATIESSLREEMKAEHPPSALHRIIVRLKGTTADAKLAAEAAALGRQERQAIIPRALRRKAEENRAPLMPLLKRGEKEGVISGVKTLWIANSLAMEASPRFIEELAQREEVAEIAADRVIRLAEPLPAPAATAGWNLERVGAPQLWRSGMRGEGVVVATLDSGVDLRHPDLQGGWRGGRNSWFDPFGNYSSPVDGDRNGHGTKVMGIIAGGDASGVAVGMAPAARWIAARIFDNSGNATVSVIHAAFQWLLDPDGDPATSDAPNVVCNSWGLDPAYGNNREFEPDIQALRAAGIAVVFAAGNYGPVPGTATSPADLPGVLSVGATEQDDTIAFYSSRGPSPLDGSFYPSLVAPGAGVRTTDLWLGTAELSYAMVSGTSFAAPHVAGAIALLLSGNPALATAQAEDAILRTASDLGSPGVDNSYGHGLVNVEAAARHLGLLPPAAVPGDVDGDGALSLADILTVLRVAVGIPLTPSENQAVFSNGDVASASGAMTPDGRVTLADALLLLRWYVGN